MCFYYLLLKLWLYTVCLVYYHYLLLQWPSFPTGLIKVSSHIILFDGHTDGLYCGPTSTNCLRGVGTPEGCFPLSRCCPVVLSLSPPHLAAGLWAASLRWLIISCLSRDHLPRGLSSITLYQRLPIEHSPSPTGVSDRLANNDSCNCQSTWAAPSIFLSAE